jgi:hypothetical protein
MYVANPGSTVQALDGATEISGSTAAVPEAIRAQAEMRAIRGLSIYAVVLLNTADAHLRPSTLNGRVVWDVEVAARAAAILPAPALAARSSRLQGCEHSAAEVPQHDAVTGQELWRTSTTPVRSRRRLLGDVALYRAGATLITAATIRR